jgi:DNA-binding transcriptional MerR regulator
MINFCIYSSNARESSTLTDMGLAEQGVYSIGAVAKMLGVPAQTLRSWEDRYGQIVPARSAGGQRLYSRQQVDQLHFILDELSRGLQPADAHRLLEERERYPLAPRPANEPALTVLLAERDPYAADFCEYLLRTEGFITRQALTADAVREYLDEEVLDLVIVDLLISGGAGPALCHQARQQRLIPAIAVSALDSRDLALESGADAFLRKPLDSLQLLLTVHDLLGTSSFLRSESRVR